MTKPTDPFWDNLTDEQTQALAASVMLAPTLEICEALLRGEQVPPSQLDQTQMARYGVRHE
jgi:hypothetical protein